MTTTGTCFCGKIQVELKGQPLASALCHCNDCRKLTSCPYSNNFIVPTSSFTITSGTSKQVAKTADSGNAIRNYFCGDCGTPLYGHKLNESGKPEDTTVVRVGIFDDAELLSTKPGVEIYTDRRQKWVQPVEEAAQVPEMMPS